MAHCTYNWTTSYFQALPLINFNLGQNKKEQLSPFPPKAMMKARRSKNTPLWHHWSRGWGGPDVSFTSFNFRRSLYSCPACVTQLFIATRKKNMQRERSGEGKGRVKGKQRGRKNFGTGNAKQKKKKLAYVRWQIKILHILVCNLGEI